MTTKKNYHCVMTIAGSDSSAGAGIQADLKTFAAIGSYGCSVITALTAQNTQGVQAIHAVPADFIVQQIQSVLNDIPIKVIKLGMLHNAKIIQAVARELSKFPAIKIVIDPVMVAKGGSLLLEQEAIESLKKDLFPLATLITPNLPEAEVLLGEKITDQDQAAQQLAAMTDCNVLLKGGHSTGEICRDCLYLVDGQQSHYFEQPRIETKNTHGTGCSLSAAIGAYLSQDYTLIDAVEKSIDYLHKAIQAGSQYQLGQGHGPVHHLFEYWP